MSEFGKKKEFSLKTNCKTHFYIFFFSYKLTSHETQATLQSQEVAIQYHNLKKLHNRSFLRLSLKSASLIHFFLFNSQAIFPQCQPLPRCLLCVCVSGLPCVIPTASPLPACLFSFFTIILSDFTVPGKEPLDRLISVTSLVRPILSYHTLFCHSSVTYYRTRPHPGPSHFQVAPPSYLSKVFTFFHLPWASLQPDLCCQSPHGILYNYSQDLDFQPWPLTVYLCRPHHYIFLLSEFN